MKVQAPSRNQLMVATNPYQGSAKRVLCVCSAGVLRSPTLANVLYKTYGFNTRAAGVTQEYALIPVSPALLVWAQQIVVIEPCLREDLYSLFGKWMKDKEVVTLNVEDRYEYGDPELENELLNQYRNNT